MKWKWIAQSAIEIRGVELSVYMPQYVQIKSSLIPIFSFICREFSSKTSGMDEEMFFSTRKLLLFVSAIHWLYAMRVRRLKAPENTHLSVALNGLFVIKMFVSQCKSYTWCHALYHNSQEHSDGRLRPISRNMIVREAVWCRYIVHAKHRKSHQPERNDWE